jgi:hypothetical protein
MSARLLIKSHVCYHFVRQNTRVYVDVEDFEQGALQTGKIPADRTGGSSKQ